MSEDTDGFIDEIHATQAIYEAVKDLEPEQVFRALNHVADSYDFSLNAGMLNQSRQVREKRRKP